MTKATAAAMILTLAVGTVNAESGSAPSTSEQKTTTAPMTWQSDWKEFTAEYPKTEGEESRTEQYMEKDVVWKATVKEVTPPKEGKKSGAVELAMDPPLRLGDYSVETLSLNPTEAEWPAWAELASSQQVVFETRLTGPWPWAKAPVQIFHMNDGRNFASLFTKGGKLVEATPNP